MSHKTFAGRHLPHRLCTRPVSSGPARVLGWNTTCLVCRELGPMTAATDCQPGMIRLPEKQ